MGEMIRIGGFDPGLRFTGFGIVNYQSDSEEIWISNCGLVKTPAKIKGLDAILYMQNLLGNISERDCFQACDYILIEMPAAIYSKTFSSGSLLPVAAIAGGLFTLFQGEKMIPVYPTVWNQAKKKEKTRAITTEIVGEYESWGYDDMPTCKSQFEHIIDAVSMALWYMRTNYLDLD